MAAVVNAGCAAALAQLLPYSHLVALYLQDNQIGDEVPPLFLLYYVYVQQFVAFNYFIIKNYLKKAHYVFIV